MLALALALRDRGHDVVFAAPPNFEGWIEAAGVAFHPVGIDVQAAVEREFEKARNPFWVPRFFARLVGDQFDGLEPLCNDGFDIVVGAGGQIAAHSLAERCGVPYVYFAYCPTFLRSAYHSPTFFRWQRLPRLLNRVLWALFCWAGTRATRAPVNAARERWGLRPLRDIYTYVFEPRHVLLATDRIIGTFPSDFGGHVDATGFLFLRDDAALPDDLAAFIDSGEAPVYLGFGSAPVRGVAAMDQVIARAAEATGRRFVVSAGPSGLGSTGLPGSCFVAGTVSHASLFPRMAAVVHHGGAGTTALAARTGRPQVVVPYSADQHYWAARVAAIGVGAEPLDHARLSAERLARRVERAVGDPRIAEAARDVADRMSRVDGVAAAADRLEAIVHASGGILNEARSNP